jgi:hypothetical protein
LSAATAPRGQIDEQVSDAASLRDYALAALEADVAVLRPKEDGTKMPIDESWVDDRGKPMIDPAKGRQGYGWKHRQTLRAMSRDIERWYGSGRHTGLGIVCGAVSGKLQPLPDGFIGPPAVLGLEMWEFEQRERWDAFVVTAHEVGLGELVERIANGYLSATPGGGIHTMTRCSEYESNLKLAMRAATAEELAKKPDETKKVIAETRGQGGFTVEPPSHGKVHPSGRPYILERGDLATIVTIAPAERQSFKHLIESFNELPDEVPQLPDEEVTARRALDSVPPLKPEELFGRGIDNELQLDPATNYDGPSALDVIAEYNRRTTWDELLTRQGWRCLSGSAAGVGHWQRPGKTEPGGSATTNYGGSDKLCVFSTTPGLKVTGARGSKAGYDRFGFYAAVEHGGDNKAAIRAASAMLGLGGRINSHAVQSSQGGVETTGATPQTKSTETPWPEPAHVLGLPAAPALDLALFPAELANVALDVTERLQCPLDYPSWPLLVSLAGLIGRKVGIRPRQYDTWTERACFWVALIGPPSWLKSPALEEGIRPLRRQAAFDREQHEAELAEWDEVCAEIRRTAKKGEKPKLPPNQLSDGARHRMPRSRSLAR